MLTAPTLTEKADILLISVTMGTAVAATEGVLEGVAGVSEGAAAGIALPPVVVPARTAHGLPAVVTVGQANAFRFQKKQREGEENAEAHLASV